MNYIRTEKGHIYEYVEQRIYPNQYAKFGVYRHNLNSEYEQIIAQADTVKELVDGYYLDLDNHSFDSTQVYDKDELEKALKEKEDWQSYSDRKYLSYEINLYAFIKTNKGFIYVAKMYGDGEAELL